MDTLFVALRVLLSLGAVLALLWWLQRRFVRGGLGAKKSSRTAPTLAVVGRQSVGSKASVVVVEHDGHRFLLGVTEHGVNVLHTAELGPDPDSDGLSSSQSGAQSLTQAAAVPGGGADRFAQVLAEAGQLPEEAPCEIEPSLVSGTELKATIGASSPSKFAGSILAPETWKQAAAFVRNSR